MRYHLAMGRSGREYEAARAARHPDILASYAAPSAVRGVLRHHLATPEMHGTGRLILDSGAYSALTLGLALNVHAFGAFAVGLAAEWGDALAELEVVNLDVIGNQGASDEHERVLRGEYGLQPVPVHTFGAPLRVLERMAARSPRLALGGLVPHAQDRATLRGWLTRCFDALDGSGARVHLLGIARPWVLEAFPVASCDSTTWSAGVRFGRGKTTGDAGRAAQVTALTSTALGAQALAAQVSRHWEGRTYRPSAQLALFDQAA